MLKVAALCLLMLACNAQSDDLFTRFAYSQMFAKCLGDDAYRAHLEGQLNATKICFQEPTRMIHNLSEMNTSDDMSFMDDGVSVAAYFGLQQEDCSLGSHGMGVSMFSQSCHTLGQTSMDDPDSQNPVIESPIMKSIMLKAASRISNYTCVLRKMGFIDENMTLLFDNMSEQVRNITSNPKKNGDIVYSIDLCRNLTNCLPEEPNSSPPKELRRMLFFFNCQKSVLIKVCMKYHLIDFLKLFDISSVPIKSKDENELATFLLNIFWGASSDEFLELY